MDVLHMTVDAGKRTAGPMLFAPSTTDAEVHQRRAVIQIDADPVPTHGLTVQVLAGPFVIEPGLADHLVHAALTRDGPVPPQLRQPALLASAPTRASLAADTGH